jgi:hypothetical protein
VLIELDTRTKKVIISAATKRPIPPFRDLNQLEMLPGKRPEADPPAAAEQLAPAPVAEKVPA